MSENETKPGWGAAKPGWGNLLRNLAVLAVLFGAVLLVVAKAT